MKKSEDDFSLDDFGEMNLDSSPLKIKKDKPKIQKSEFDFEILTLEEQPKKIKTQK